jgi:hypothetical protein
MREAGRAESARRLSADSRMSTARRDLLDRDARRLAMQSQDPGGHLAGAEVRGANDIIDRGGLASSSSWIAARARRTVSCQPIRGPMAGEACSLARCSITVATLLASAERSDRANASISSATFGQSTPRLDAVAAATRRACAWPSAHSTRSVSYAGLSMAANVAFPNTSASGRYCATLVYTSRISNARPLGQHALAVCDRRHGCAQMLGCEQAASVCSEYSFPICEHGAYSEHQFWTGPRPPAPPPAGMSAAFSSPASAALSNRRKPASVDVPVGGLLC